MHPQCRARHSTCSSGRLWVPDLIAWLILIRQRDGVWWWCSCFCSFLVWCSRSCPFVNIFIKFCNSLQMLIFCLMHKIDSCGHLLARLLTSFLRWFLGTSVGSRSSPGSMCWKSNKDFHLSQKCSGPTPANICSNMRRSRCANINIAGLGTPVETLTSG